MPTNAGAGNPNVTISATLDQASLAALSSTIEDALQKGFDKGINEWSKAMADATKKLGLSLNKFFTKATTGAKGSGQKAGASWTQGFQQQLQSLDPAIKTLYNTLENTMGKAAADLHSVQMVAMSNLSQFQQAFSTQQAMSQAAADPNVRRTQQMHLKSAGTATWAATATAQSDLAVLREQAKEAALITRQQGELVYLEQKSAADQALVLAKQTAAEEIAVVRQSQERKTAILKAFLKSAVLFQKAVGKALQMTARAVGTVLAGAAKTATSAVSRMTSSIGRLFSRSNRDINDGLDGALSRRERDMRSSFDRQEGILSRSAVKQKAQLDKINKQTSSGILGALTGKGAGMGIAGLVGGFSLASFLKDGYNEAVNLNEQINKTKVLFGQAGDNMIAFTADAVNSMGSTQAEALTAIGTFGNLFRSMNWDEMTAGKVSGALTKLAGDLSSFNNVPVEDVFDALRSGLVGETEPLRKFGIQLNDARLKQEAMTLGLYDGEGQLSANAKAMAAFQLIMKDTKLAQGDLARTIDEGANAQRRAKNSLRELATTIMGKLVPVVTVLANATTTATQAFTNMLKSTNPLLVIMKTALVGVAKGMAAIVAAKGVIQVFKLLGPAIKLVLSPLGSLLIVAGLIGAAFELMMNRSKPLREAFKKVGEQFRALFDGASDFGKGIKTAVADVINNKILPAVDSLASWLARNLVPAFEAVVRFVFDKLIPAFMAIAGFVINTVVPAVVRLGEVLFSAFMSALPFIQRFFGAIVTLIQPAIDGFIVLKDAIGDAFGGDFGNLGGGFAAFGKGIVESIGNIIGRIGELLAPVGKAIVDWFKNYFTGERLKDIGMAILNVVETIGYVLGRIVTHPTFLKAVAAIIAAAAVIGFQLIKGIVRGIIDNLPALGDMFKSALGFLLKQIGKFILDNLGVILATALVAALVLPQLIARVKKAASVIGNAVAVGTSNGMKAGLTNAGQGVADYYRGLFGKASQVVARQQAALQKQMDAINKRRQVVGAAPIAVGAANMSDKQIAAAEKEIRKLESAYSSAQLAGMRARLMLQQFGVAAAGVAAGLKQVNSGLKLVGQQLAGGIQGTGKSWGAQFKMAGGQMRDGVKQMWTSISTYAKEQGTSAMKMVGAAAATALTAGFASFQTGKSQGESGTSGGMAVLTSAMSGIAAGAAVGGPFGAAVGGATAAVGLLGYAFGAAGRDAKKFKEDVSNLSSALEGELKSAVEDGTIALDDLKQGILDMKDVANMQATIDEFTTQLGDDGVKDLKRFGINWEDNIAPLLNSGKDFAAIKTDVIDMFSGMAGSSTDFKNIFGKDAEKVAGVVAEFLKPGGDSELYELSNSLNSALGYETWNKLKNNGATDFLQDLMYTAGDLGRAIDVTEASVENLNAKGAVFGSTWDIEEKSSAFTTFGQYLTDLGTVAAGVSSIVAGVFNPTSTLQQKIDEAIIQLSGAGTAIQSALESDQDASVIQAQVSQQKTQAKATISGAIEQAIRDGVVVDTTTARQFAQPLIDSYLSGISDPATRAQLEQELNTSVRGVIVNLPDIKTRLDKEELLAELEQFRQENPLYEELSVNTVKTLAALGITQDEIQTQLDTNPAFAGLEFNEAAIKLKTDEAAKVLKKEVAGFNLKPEGTQLAQDLVDGFSSGVIYNTSGATNAMGDFVDAVVTYTKTKLKIKSPSKVYKEIGVNMAEGMAQGLKAGTATVKTAAEDLAATAAQASADWFAKNAGTQALGAGTGPSPVDALMNVTLGVQGLLGSLESTAKTAMEIGGKKFEELTAAEKDIYGESAVSLSTKDVLGAQNIQAIQSMLDTIVQHGTSLLAAGKAPKTVAKVLQGEVDQVRQILQNLGFNMADVDKIIDRLGLSPADLAVMVKEAKMAAVDATTPDTPATTALPTVKGMGAGQGAGVPKIGGDVNIQIVTPYGDPQAIALATANRVAASV